MQAAAERDIVVTNVPGYGTPSVAQLVFALILELTHHVGHHAQTVREGRWSASADFCYWEYPLIELAGKTLGIDRKSTRLNSSHANISYAVFCLKKKQRR